MNRKTFLKNSLLSSMLLGIAGPLAASGKAQQEQPEVLGYEHLPLGEDYIMPNLVLHPANTRGQANHGWLESRFSFSFASYYNPKRMHFGCLRVLNDDIVAGGRGFGMHPHDNMEIISIPLSGALEHKDTMGNKAIINEQDVQVMSAGTGVQHSEFNHFAERSAKFLQIWVFPNKVQVKPRYDQKTFKLAERQNRLQTVVSPLDKLVPGSLGVHQDAWFSLGRWDANQKQSYKLKGKGTGLYAFVIDGDWSIAGQNLGRRDALGIWDVQQVELQSRSQGEILLIEVPMDLPKF